MNAAELDVPQDAICRRCRYSLRGLTRAICPECGTEFDPDVSRSYLSQSGLRGASVRRMRFLIGGVTYCALCCVVSFLFLEENGISHLLRGPLALLHLGMLGSMLGGGTLVVCSMCFCGSALAPRRIAIALFVLGLIWWHLAGLGRILMDPWL